MTLVRPPMTNFKMTVRADCAVSAHSPLPLPVKILASWLSGRGGAGPWTGVCPPPTQVAGIQNKASFPFHQTCPFIGFWAARSQTPLVVILTYVRGQINIWWTLTVSATCWGQKMMQTVAVGDNYCSVTQHGSPRPPRQQNCSSSCRVEPKFQRWPNYPVCPTKVLVWNFPLLCWKLHQCQGNAICVLKTQVLV